MNMTCPYCNNESGIREIIYGLPAGPVDESKYEIGGCCITPDDPTWRCIHCGWSGNEAPHSREGGLE